MTSFSAAEARAITGATQRQLDYWANRGVVPASLTPKHGKGHERRYSYSDLVRLWVVVRLRQAGVSLQRIRKALGLLKKRGCERDPFTGRSIVSDGRNVYLRTLDPDVLEEISHQRQLVFGVFVLGETVEKAQRTIDLHLQQRAEAS